MKLEEGFFKSFDQTNLYYRAALYESRLAILLIHGYGDHCTRYQDLIEELKELPISWFAFDLRGQGKSEGQRVYAENFETFVKDVEQFYAFISKQFPNHCKKVILMGHSFGGLIAARAIEKSGELFGGLILTSPCFQPAGISWWLPTRLLARLLNRLAPRLVLNNFVKPKYLFKNPVKMDSYLRDRLIERRISGRLSHVLLRACEESEHMKLNWKGPLLVLASGDDHIVSLEATKRWFENVWASSKEMKIYPKLYHELFNELDHKEPLRDLKHFLIKLLEV